MAYANSQTVKILTGDYAGRYGTVLATERSGKVLVVIEGLLGTRRYSPTSVEPAVAPVTPPPVPTAPPAPAPAAPGWTLAFSDDFAGPAVNTSAWALYDGVGHAGNGRRDPRAWSIVGADIAVGATGSALCCTAWWDAAGGQVHAGGMAHRLNTTQHRMEVRCRVEPDPSGVTAANMPLTWPQDETSGECNPFECSTDLARAMKCFVHYERAGALPQIGPLEHGVSGTDWHTVTYERLADRLSVWVDGVPKVNITDRTKIPQAPHHMCLQLDAMKNAPMSKPVRMFVDHVRIWTPA